MAAKFNGGKTLAIFIRFDGEQGKNDRAALDRLAVHYAMSRAEVMRHLIREADKFRDEGKWVKKTKNGRKLDAVAQ